MFECKGWWALSTIFPLFVGAEGRIGGIEGKGGDDVLGTSWHPRGLPNNAIQCLTPTWLIFDVDARSLVP